MIFWTSTTDSSTPKSESEVRWPHHWNQQSEWWLNDWTSDNHHWSDISDVQTANIGWQNDVFRYYTSDTGCGAVSLAIGPLTLAINATSPTVVPQAPIVSEVFSATKLPTLVAVTKTLNTRQPVLVIEWSHRWPDHRHQSLERSLQPLDHHHWSSKLCIRPLK